MLGSFLIHLNDKFTRQNEFSKLPKRHLFHPIAKQKTILVVFAIIYWKEECWQPRNTFFRTITAKNERIHAAAISKRRHHQLFER